jgi:uncharacterized protein YidB (DUF937 family)
MAAAKPPPSSILPSLPPSGTVAPDPGFMPLWRQIGADSCRVSLVDLKTQSHLAGRWMNEGGAAGGVRPEQTVDSTIPGVMEPLSRLSEGDSGGDSPVAHMLSPRRWVYCWKVDEHIALMAQVHFVVARTVTSPFDTAVVRLICEHWLAPELQAIGSWRAAAVPWDRAERRARAPAPRALWWALASLLACALIGAWLALIGAPAAAERYALQQGEILRLTELADSTLVRNLSAALAGGDYGELQEALTQHAGLGHFAAAVVGNARSQVVAQAGVSPGLRIGAAVPEDLIARSRVMPLTAGGQRLGQLLLVAGQSSAPAPGSGIDRLLRAGAVLLCLVALVGAGWLGHFVRRRAR